MEFFIGSEKLQATADAIINAVALLVKLFVFGSIRAFSASGAGHAILLLREALFPFGFREDDFGLGHGLIRFSRLLVLRAGGGDYGYETEKEKGRFHGDGYEGTNVGDKKSFAIPNLFSSKLFHRSIAHEIAQ
jgi:hypothetical protein